jgi:hypothetical protein
MQHPNTQLPFRAAACALATAALTLSGASSARAATRAVTLEGRLFYNDLRSIGHAEWRRDPDGDVGQLVGYAPAAVNLLAAWYVVADLFELDGVDGAPAHPDCSSQTLLGSATIDYRGEYRFSESIPDDDCEADGDAVPDLGVRFRLRFCNGETRCFSLEDDEQTNYRLWHRHAQPAAPLQGTSGHHVLADGTFQAAPHDDYAKAANLYAGLVEATDVVHLQNAIPFYEGGEEELFVRYPSSTVLVATTTSGHQVHYPAVNDWIVGGYHEFGHVLHFRAWEGTLGACGDCPGGQYARDGHPSWSAVSREYPHAAFMEGWANFVSRVVEDWPEGCGATFDANDDTWLCSADANQYPQAAMAITYPNDGKSYPRNVTKLLCDWYDDGAWNDDDPLLAGAGDHFTATLSSIWSNLESLWDQSGGAAGLEICDYLDYYLNERKSAANVGQDVHDDYVAWITDLSYNDGISCFLSPPAALAAPVALHGETERALCEPPAACGARDMTRSTLPDRDVEDSASGAANR